MTLKELRNALRKAKHVCVNVRTHDNDCCYIRAVKADVLIQCTDETANYNAEIHGDTLYID